MRFLRFQDRLARGLYWRDHSNLGFLAPWESLFSLFGQRSFTGNGCGITYGKNTSVYSPE